jgi:hypothetical protein
VRSITIEGERITPNAQLPVGQPGPGSPSLKQIDASRCQNPTPVSKRNIGVIRCAARKGARIYLMVFTKYRRTQIAEMEPWVEGYDMTRVSVSTVDREAGSPKSGDMIARNPANHDDKWLVGARYFVDNFEPLVKNASAEPE